MVAVNGFLVSREVVRSRKLGVARLARGRVGTLAFVRTGLIVAVCGGATAATWCMCSSSRRNSWRAGVWLRRHRPVGFSPVLLEFG